MTAHVTLTLRAPLNESIEAHAIVPDAFATLHTREVESLPVWAGRQQQKLADYFTVDGECSTSVRVVGDVRRANGVGSGMASGNLVVDGDAGSRVAAGMTGGKLEVLGSVADDAGVGMTGGSLRVRKNAGHRIGAATPGASRGIAGGEIVVDGSVGDDSGARMRRGLLFVGGNAGDRAGRAMIAGTLIVIGHVGVEPGYANKRGSLIVTGGINVPVTYRYACDFEPPHVRLALTYLARRYGVRIAHELVDGVYRRYCGDAGTVAKGEILQWVRA